VLNNIHTEEEFRLKYRFDFTKFDEAKFIEILKFDLPAEITLGTTAHDFLYKT
jgi:hypothetical protein